ncbi:hypothetical protein [Sorangium sp. So ce854]|uniref:hypothetical protein n=1 Tax=Sorangium sp. So ce854 TaxID=3133322 RepID=UPI003F612CEF
MPKRSCPEAQLAYHPVGGHASSGRCARSKASASSSDTSASGRPLAAAASSAGVKKVDLSQGAFTQHPEGARPVENGPVQSRWEHQSATGDTSGNDLERPHTHGTSGYVWGQSDSSWWPSQVRRRKR